MMKVKKITPVTKSTTGVMQELHSPPEAADDITANEEHHEYGSNPCQLGETTHKGL